MVIVIVILVWNEVLRFIDVWSFVRYGLELEENVYFVKVSRDDFVICLKKYGNFMRLLYLCFGYFIENFLIVNIGE